MKISIGRKILAAFAFWGLALFGGVIVMLWNALAPYFAQYRAGDLGYAVLQTIATPIGAILAAEAADSITNGICKLFCMVNCVIAATAFATITFLNLWMGGGSLQSMISMALSICVFVYCAHSFSKEISASTEERNDYVDILRKYEESLPIVEVFEHLAKESGVSVSEYTTQIRILIKQSGGMSEAEARRVVELEDRERAAALKWKRKK